MSADLIMRAFRPENWALGVWLSLTLRKVRSALEAVSCTVMICFSTAPRVN